MDEPCESTRLLQPPQTIQRVPPDERDPRRRMPRWHPSYFVIAIAAVERLGQRGILTNLVLFLESHGLLKWSPATVNIVALLVTNVPMVLAAVTGALTDCKISRYAMLYAGLLLQFLGSAFLTAACFLEHHYSPEFVRDLTLRQDYAVRSLILVGLLLLAMGMTAAYGAEIALGVEQYWLRKEPPAVAASFIPLYYWWINVAATVVIGALSYVQLNHGFRLGLAPATAAYLACLVGVHALHGRLRTTAHLVHRGGLSDLQRVCKAAWTEWRRSGKGGGGGVERWRAAGATDLPGRPLLRGSQSWLCYAELQTDPRIPKTKVTDARNFASLVLVLLPTLLYDVIMVQTATTFTSQGDVMSVPVHYKNESRHGILGGNITGDLLVPTFIPSTLVGGVSGVAIIVAIPLLYGLVYPRLDNSTVRWRLTLFRRMGIGMFVALLSILCATAVEVERRQDDRFNATSRYDPQYTHTHTASSLSIFWQIPQYVLSGVAEVLVFLSALEFAYCKSPPALKGLCIGLVYTMSGLSGMLSAMFIYLLTVTDSTVFFGSGAKGIMHFYFAGLGGFILIGTVCFVVATRRYVYVQRVAG